MPIPIWIADAKNCSNKPFANYVFNDGKLSHTRPAHVLRKRDRKQFVATRPRRDPSQPIAEELLG
ncbi:MAG: hypothetical protein DMF00_16230, partial [Verrucomicrobia bacterium]